MRCCATTEARAEAFCRTEQMAVRFDAAGQLIDSR